MGKRTRRRQQPAATVKNPLPSAEEEEPPLWTKYVEEDLVGGVKLYRKYGPVDDKFMEEFEEIHRLQPHNLHEALTRCGYYDQLRNSQGFEVSKPPFETIYGLLIEPANRSHHLVRGSAAVALSFIRKVKRKKGMGLELVEVVGANARHDRGYLFYLTFTARDKFAADQPL
ncbi:hypothetical protein Tsubulata_044456 [Turnera subulata]|uniref:Uncharacterized protein n=1 Tax=Turnera subulata TaxID=218843 RepID=A0A9Q0JGW2_9ROSI|nr:hypothetical protein Tsubulata_044456 [Turnera subulata]